MLEIILNTKDIQTNYVYNYNYIKSKQESNQNNKSSDLTTHESKDINDDSFEA